MKRIAALALLLIACLAGAVWAADSPETGGFAPAQDAADVLRSFTGSDVAFIAAGQLRSSADKENLASILQYPTEGVAVLNLSGSQIRQALETSVSLYPQPNTSFLQVSGIEVSFKAGGAPGNRLTAVMVNGGAIDNSRTYSVAMPSSLARGSLGFFRIWNKVKPAKTFEGTTIEDVLRGKRSTGSASRWSVQ